MPSTSLPRIAVIGTGGTISSLGANSLDVLDYPDFGQKLTSERLIERFPEARLVAEPVPVTFRQVGSTAIGPKDWVELREHDSPHRAGGFRLSPGLSSRTAPRLLEETAFFLNLTLGVQPAGRAGRGAATGQRARHRRRNEPGQRAARRGRCRGARHGRAGRDERRDPSGARCGLRPRPIGCRPSARSITARSGMSMATGPHFYRAPLKAHMPDTPFAGREIGGAAKGRCRKRSYAGADGDLVEAAVTAGAQGLVSAGFAPGTPSPAQQAAFLEAATGRGSSSCNEAARPAASRRAAACARPASSPARI